ncbi:DUF2336 domain-containing protein [Paenochrobactrum sp. BZR 588]|uniref:DUF2336 domain-containing protein n=1 Tax=unclassified Paenochrobactrum TaxID=2639760 RepID=UPI003853AAF5
MTRDQYRALEGFSISRNPADSKADDLLTAAISGYASITRPGRQELLQLEDLAMPLIDYATAKGKRDAAMRLVHMQDAPHSLVFKLAHEPTNISAPLLLRSDALSTSDLLHLIESRGIGHARIVARRHDQDALLIGLLQSFDDAEINQILERQGHLPSLHNSEQIAKPQAEKTNSQKLMQIHQQLNMMMRDANVDLEHSVKRNLPPQSAYQVPENHLIDSALLINCDFFRTALADALGVSLERAKHIIGEWPSSQLPIALKALNLSAQDCYLIMTAVLGTIHGDRDSLRDFVNIYRSIKPETAQQIIERWKAEDNMIEHGGLKKTAI